MLILMLTGCSNNKQSKTVTPESVFSSSFVLNYNTLQLKGLLSVDKNQKYIVSLTKPTILNGLNAVYVNDNLTLSYNGIKSNVDIDSIPQTAFIPIMFGTLKQIFKTQDLIFNSTESGYETTGTTDYGNYTLSLDNNCKIKSLMIKEKKFSLTLENSKES